METKNPDVAVLIGRFQPFHNGHAGLLERAFETAPRVVLVLGSAHAARSPRNPFTASEREAMIRSTLSDDKNRRLVVVPQRDVWGAKRWSTEVRARVEGVSRGRIVLVGFHKDASSYYLDLFPGWGLVETGRQGHWDATPVRERILSRTEWAQVHDTLRADVPDSVLAWLDAWSQGGVRDDLAEDGETIRDYCKQWGKGPFLTVDSLVRCAGRVLVVTRGKRPGKGLWALPGGFLESFESMLDGARRELKEETGLDLSGHDPVDQKYFDHPGRSLRARIVTQVFRFELARDVPPSVTGMDDAGIARWLSVDEIRSQEDRFFEDHFHLVDTMLGGIV
ncbi:MAG TPA: NUDIX domain-containing protein [Fibrobacteria bacterium]|nr:NUDIX domain-containing protein [Fibrobacteria bacterium]HOX52368.1 NUDIX domain-containing protein [Fibrobacteria bacterium]